SLALGGRVARGAAAGLRGAAADLSGAAVVCGVGSVCQSSLSVATRSVGVSCPAGSSADGRCGLARGDRTRARTGAGTTRSDRSADAVARDQFVAGRRRAGDVVDGRAPPTRAAAHGASAVAQPLVSAHHAGRSRCDSGATETTWPPPHRTARAGDGDRGRRAGREGGDRTLGRVSRTGRGGAGAVETDV